MLSFLTLVWGILAIIGLLIGFIPCVSTWNWVNLPFDILGACMGIVAIFTRKEGGSRLAVIGIALCMAASIIELLRLVSAEGTA